MYYHAHLIRIIVIVAQVSNVTSGPLVCFPVHSNNSVKSYMANYETAMFPRYEYHLELIRKIVDRADPMDDNTITRDISTLPESTILVYGRETDVDMNLLKPLVLEDSNGNGNY